MKNIKKGTILVSDTLSKAPYGFLRKITAVTESGGKIICQTAPASLVEAIKEGEVKFSKKLTDSDIVSIDSSGKNNANSRLSHIQSTAFRKAFTKTIGAVDITGEFEIDPTINFELTIKGGKMTHFKVSTDVKATTKIKGEVVTVREIVPEPVVLVNYRLKPVVIWVELVPIVFVPRIIVSVDVNGKVTSTTSMQASANLDVFAGIEYKNEEWKNLKNVTKTGSKLEFIFSKKMQLTASIKPDFVVRLYDSEDVQVSLSPTASLIGELIDSDYCGTLDWGVDVDGKVFVKLLDKRLADYTGKIYSDKFQIFKGKPSELRKGGIKVGDEAFGGVVFYVEPNGKHGLVMAKSPLNASWWPDKAPYVTPGNFNLPSDMSLGAGQANTKKLIGTGATPYIAGICDDLVVQDCYDDWFLPSVGELKELAKYASQLPAFRDLVLASSNLEDVKNMGYLILLKTVRMSDGKVGEEYLTDPQMLTRLNFKHSFVPIRSF
ncbi:hypothetical protein GCM10023091_37040 [Ravibacter arvi]|uniref:Uncharacterized protein n=1 Tax=Ravibacter arvi TaxID=2051041 RepID=A0ABP8M929_9BACT